MKNLASLNKYFIKYKWQLLLGMVFVTTSSYFAVRPANIVKDVLDEVAEKINANENKAIISKLVVHGGLLLIGLALLRGIFMFLMRQTIIVMSRHIEYDQKNEIYNHYQQLHTQFYKTHFTGDLMNRISEDVSRVRMYTGPSIMYLTSVLSLIVLCIWQMLQVSGILTLCVIAPLPFLALSIYFVNKIIFRKSGKIQAQLSDLTTTAQESYSGIRVIKSFMQEKTMLRFFENNSELYRKSAINLSLTEAIYFPAISFFIGLSIISTIMVGGYFVIQGTISVGNIAQFIFYINILAFPVSSIGAVASMMQRAGASQKRIDEFLHTKGEIVSPPDAISRKIVGAVEFNNVTFTYPHTGITALKYFSLNVNPGDKIAIIGKTGSGKSTIAQLLLRMYDVQSGKILIDTADIRRYNLQELRTQISYAPQDAFLFSDSVYNNIKFGRDDATEAEVIEASFMADLDKDVTVFPKKYETIIGERGVMLSGGQKQRMALARAILKKSKLLILDDCLSAVDTQTEKTILGNLRNYRSEQTVFVITHRILTSWTFDKIIVLDDGVIAEQGTHDELVNMNGRYAKLYRHQTETA